MGGAAPDRSMGERAVAATPTRSATHAEPPRTSAPAQIAILQRLAGNSAVASVIGKGRCGVPSGSSPTRHPPVQRQNKPAGAATGLDEAAKNALTAAGVVLSAEDQAALVSAFPDGVVVGPPQEVVAALQFGRGSRPRLRQPHAVHRRRPGTPVQRDGQRRGAGCPRSDPRRGGTQPQADGGTSPFRQASGPGRHRDDQHAPARLRAGVG